MISPKKIILDTDPGIDDILAIFLACSSPEVDLLGVTTVAGNVKVNEGANNAVAARDVLSDNYFPIFQGAWRPLTRRLKTQADVYGTDEEIGIEYGTGWVDKIEKKKAVYFLIETINLFPGEVTLFPLAPLTNIASAIILDSNFSKNVKEIYLMGGAAAVPGNATPTTEFNLFVDPEAAKVVFNSGIPMTMIGLDVTGKTALWPADKDALDEYGTKISGFVREITRHYLDRNRPCYLYDPLAVAVGIDSTLITRNELYHVDIETSGEYTAGTTVVDWHNLSGKEKNVRVCLQVDSDAFRKMFWDRVIISLSEKEQKHHVQ
jgi:purine nucleosidase